jgi:FimV-like protein
MNECRRCGKSYSIGQKFCGFCGFNLTVSNTGQLVTAVTLKSSDIKLDLAKTYYEMGKYKQALQTLEKFLKENPKNPEAHKIYEQWKQALKLQYKTNK